MPQTQYYCTVRMNTLRAGDLGVRNQRFPVRIGLILMCKGELFQVKMNKFGLVVVVGMKPFILAEIEKLGAEADSVKGGCWLEPFLESWSKFTPKSINFHLCVYLIVLSKTLKPIS